MAIIMALAGSTLAAAIPPPGTPLPGPLAALQREAAAQQRPFVVYVHLPQVKACRKMDRSWKDATLAQYVAGHYLVREINGLEADPEFLQTYQVQRFPTVIIFSPEGKLMGRTEGYVEPVTLTQILRKHVLRLHRRQPLQGLPPLAIDLSPAPLRSHLNPVPVLAAQTPPAAPLRLRRPVPGLEAYALPLETGHQLGVQVGEHADVQSLTRQVRRLEKIWRGPLWVFAEEGEAAPTYKIMVGQYEDPAQAARFAQGLEDLAGLPAKVMPLPAGVP